MEKTKKKAEMRFTVSEIKSALAATDGDAIAAAKILLSHAEAVAEAPKRKIGDDDDDDDAAADDAEDDAERYASRAAMDDGSGLQPAAQRARAEPEFDDSTWPGGRDAFMHVLRFVSERDPFNTVPSRVSRAWRAGVDRWKVWEPFHNDVTRHALDGITAEKARDLKVRSEPGARIQSTLWAAQYAQMAYLEYALPFVESDERFLADQRVGGGYTYTWELVYAAGRSGNFDVAHTIVKALIPSMARRQTFFLTPVRSTSWSRLPEAILWFLTMGATHTGMSQFMHELTRRAGELVALLGLPRSDNFTMATDDDGKPKLTQILANPRWNDILQLDGEDGLEPFTIGQYIYWLIAYRFSGHKQDRNGGIVPYSEHRTPSFFHKWTGVNVHKNQAWADLRPRVQYNQLSVRTMVAFHREHVGAADLLSTNNWRRFVSGPHMHELLFCPNFVADDATVVEVAANPTAERQWQPDWSSVPLGYAGMVKTAVSYLGGKGASPEPLLDALHRRGLIDPQGAEMRAIFNTEYNTARMDKFFYASSIIAWAWNNNHIPALMLDGMLWMLANNLSWDLWDAAGHALIHSQGYGRERHQPDLTDSNRTTIARALMKHYNESRFPMFGEEFAIMLEAAYLPTDEWTVLDDV